MGRVRARNNHGAALGSQFNDTEEGAVAGSQGGREVGNGSPITPRVRTVGHARGTSAQTEPCNKYCDPCAVRVGDRYVG